MPTIQKQLILHEELKLKAYKCPEDYWTIGVGRNLEANPLSFEETLRVLKEVGINKEIAMDWLNKKIEQAREDLGKFDWFNDLSHVRKKVIIDMYFNLGLEGLLKFKRMIGKIEERDWEGAAFEMLDSDWSGQVGQRAKRLSKMMRTGEDYEK